MKILCLTKRRPQGRDLFTQPYGRFYHLPRLLAERGHDVHILMLSYDRNPPATRREGNLQLRSVSAFPWGPVPYVGAARRAIRETRPDWVVGFSDIWYGILAQRLARAGGTRSLVDAYDNYESYIPWLHPLHKFWRRALDAADTVTAAGPQLAQFMSASAAGRPVEVVPMAADPAFHTMDRDQCRRRLGLPLERRLVGYTGSLHPSRGIGMLFDIHRRLKELEPDVDLAISGRLARGVMLPPDVHWLGYRNPDEVPLILNALDLLFVLNTPSPFGNFSYPVKLYEAMCCGIPVVAADVSGTSWILRDHLQFLATPGSTDDFVEKTRAGLKLRRYDYGEPAGWSESAHILEQLLNST